MMGVLTPIISAIVLALAAQAAVAPRQTADRYNGNPFQGVQMWPSRFYADQVHRLALPRMSGEARRKAEKVAMVPSFQWLDNRGKIPLFRDQLKEIRAANQDGASPPYAGIFVIYNFPERDCSAKASAGELWLDDDGLTRYKREYIDQIRAALLEYPDVRTIFVYEPDSFPNLVTSLGNEKCARAERVYREGAIYAMQSLNLPNVAIYLDAGHAGWLGHAGSVGRTAALFNELYELAQRPRAVRGLATNVSNFNGFNLTSPPIYAQGSGSNWDEWRYVSALTPHLEGGGFPAHFIIDTGRSGQQPAGRTSWSQWCNLLGTGFGVRPTSDGVPAEAKRIVDAFVWVKPGGEADGTSDRNAPRYDENCGGEHAMQPAPEAGEWFQEYFEQLINLANPPL